MDERETKVFRLECGCGSVLYVDAKKGDQIVIITCPDCGHTEAHSYENLEDMENRLDEWP